MQALVFHGTSLLRLEEHSVPQVPPGEVLVKVAACGICGSDLHGFLGHSARRTAHIPLVMGHEFSGSVAAMGEAVAGFTVGDRVVIQPQISCGRCPACRSGRANICPNMSILGIERQGAFADYVSVPADRIFKIPDGLGEIEASLTETLAVEVHLFRQYMPLYPRTVVVLGVGAQGLFAVQLARNAGAAQIIASDLFDDRLELAARAGASTIIRADHDDPIRKVRDLTDGWGADLVIDAVGAPIIREQGLAMLAPGATLALVGLGKGETMLNYLPVVGKELRIQGSYCYSDDDFLLAMQMLANGQIQSDGMVQTAPLSEGEGYFRRLTENPAGLTKVVLLPQ